MLSLTLLAFGLLSTAVSATGSPAIHALEKRHDIPCGNDYYCLAGTYCVAGEHGIPVCCNNGETCTTDGGVSTVFQTAYITVIHTSTLGVVPSPTTTTTTTSTATTSTSASHPAIQNPLRVNPLHNNNNLTATTTYSASNPILTLTTTTTPLHPGNHTTTTTTTTAGNGTQPTVSPPVIPPPSSGAADAARGVWMGVFVGIVGVLGVVIVG